MVTTIVLKHGSKIVTPHFYLKTDPGWHHRKKDVLDLCPRYFDDVLQVL